MTTEPETGTSGLERRYRLLLAFWYPEEHRRRYEGEMLAILLDGARPGQRWPSVRDVADLAGNGLRARLRAAGAGRMSRVWTDAAAVMALLAAIGLLAQRVARVTEHLIVPGPPPAASLVVRAVAWAAVVVAILAGWRRVAASCAWLTVLAEAALAAVYYVDSPVPAAAPLTPLALGVAAAVALTLPVPPRRAFAVLGPVRLAAFALALVAGHGTLLAQSASFGPPHGPGPSYVLWGLEAATEPALHLKVAVLGGAILAGLLAVTTLPRPVRRRVYVLVAPVAALGAWIWLQTSGEVARVSPYYWLTLAAVPLAVVTFVAIAVRLPERFTRRGPSRV